MLFVACSGFPIPVSRYFREFGAVEIADTELGLPGEGTVRRWVRESPKGYGFSVIAPKSIADAGFQRTPEVKETCAGLVELGSTLKAKAIVFTAPEEFKHGKANKALLSAFVKGLPAKMPPVVFDLPSWKPDQVASIDPDRPVVPAYDPLKDEAPAFPHLAYVRLPGPAGHRSRYDEASIDRIAEHVAALRSEVVFCVFRNIDMQANASQLRKKLGK